MYEINTWSVTDNSLLGSSYYGYPISGTSQVAPNYVDSMFCTLDGLLCQYIKIDNSNFPQNYIYIYNPSSVGAGLQPITKFKTNSEFTIGYSHTHKAALGFNRTTGTAALYSISLLTGAHLQVGILDNTTAPPGGDPVYAGICSAWDGTYLHILSPEDWNVHVYDISTGAWIRKYGAPFNNQTYSMQYDRAGSMWFGSFATSANPLQTHFAKVAIGTGGATPEGTILGVYAFDLFNTGTEALKSTMVAWTGQHLVASRRATGTYHRLELSQTPQTVIISPSPARIPADGSTSQILVKVLDATGQVIPGVMVTIAIDNGSDSGGPIPPYGSFTGLTTRSTDINGQAVFTYTSTANVIGTDYIKATVNY